MRAVALLLTLTAVLAGCGRTDTPPAADTAMPMATTDMPAPMSMASFAGRWNVVVMGEMSDSVLTRYVLTATGDSTGWSFVFPTGAAIPMRVTGMAGDSIMTQAGPFPSQLRKGTQVTTDGAFRMQGDKMVGTTIAHYVTSGADSVVRLRIEGTRAQ